MMKAFLFFAAAVVLSTQVKAQQKDNQLKPLIAPQFNLKTDSSLLKQLDKNKDWQLFKIPQVTAPNAQQLLTPFTPNATSIAVNDKMPRVNTYNTDHMPIVKTDEPGMKYTMLIKKVDINTPVSVTKQDTVKFFK